MARETERASDLVELLASLPVKNLEKKISMLNSELESRIRISNEIIAGINSRLKELEALRWRSRYSDPGNWGMRHVDISVSEREKERTQELITCFRDCLELKQQLIYSRAELRRARARLRLLAE